MSIVEDLQKAAQKARQHAYAPYSNYTVGAALKDSSGQTSFGCNVENASYGATICAERNAIIHWVSQNGSQNKITDLLVLTEGPNPAPPCGPCLQVISEFGTNDTQIHICSASDGHIKTFTLNQLLPYRFQGDYLQT